MGVFLRPAEIDISDAGNYVPELAFRSGLAQCGSPFFQVGHSSIDNGGDDVRSHNSHFYDYNIYEFIIDVKYIYTGLGVGL
jgi:hypothetical protein